MEDFEVVFVFWDREGALCFPDVDNGIGNHAGIAAGASGAKGVCVINKDLTGKPLDNKPRFMRRQDQASAVELFDVQGASLSPRGSQSNLLHASASMMKGVRIEVV